MSDYTDRKNLEHIATAMQVAEAHHGVEAADRLAELEAAIEDGQLLTIGELSLMGKEVNVAKIKPIMDEDTGLDRNFAVLVLGDKTTIEQGAGNIRCSAIIDSVIERSSEVSDGSVVINSHLEYVKIRDTKLEDAHLKGVRGSSGGNEITGDIEYANIAASGPQVLVTPYPKIPRS